MQSKLLPLVLLLAACGASHNDAPPPDWVVGKYHYSGSGVVAGKFPWDAKADLVLDDDGQYTLDINVHVNDEKGGDADSDESYGTYRVERNRIILEPADHDEGEVTEFEIRDGRLYPKLNWIGRLALRGLKVQPVLIKTR